MSRRNTRKTPEPAGNRLRPGLLLNCVLLGVLLAAIGTAYVWLRLRKGEIDEKIVQTERDIKDTEKKTASLNIRISQRLADAELRAQLDRLNIGLVSIPTGTRGRLLTLPPATPGPRLTDPEAPAAGMPLSMNP